MKVLGIIAEYNPFHNGHKYHLMQSKALTEADYTVCVMSGNFLQRGEAALWDKWQRAQMAVDNGVNLVLELPFPFACNNAEEFAYGAVGILNGLDCVTDLSFGSELGSVSSLSSLANFLAFEEPGYKEQLRFFLDKGISFPKARYEAIKVIKGGETAEILQSPNNILALEYLKQCALTKSKMKIHTVRRQDDGYHSVSFSDTLASAKAIRKIWLNSFELKDIEAFIPEETEEVINQINRSDKEKQSEFDKNLSRILFYRLRTASIPELGHLYSAAEGLENRVKQALTKSVGLDELIDNIKTKRYTETRIKRMLMHALLNLDKDSYRKIKEERLLYGRILGFDKGGAKLLRYLKKKGDKTIPLYTNINKDVSAGSKEELLLQYDILAGDLYNLLISNQLYDRSDYVLAPYYKK